MSEHDWVCPDGNCSCNYYPCECQCRCDLIARVRDDQTERAIAAVQAMRCYPACLCERCENHGYVLAALRGLLPNEEELRKNGGSDD